MMIKIKKIKWIKLAVNSHSSFSPVTMKALTKVQNLNVFLLSNFDMEDFKHVCPFYKDVLQCLSEIRYTDDKTVNGFLSQFIFFNKYIKIDNKYIYNRKMLEIGLWRVGDIFADGKIIPFQVWHDRGLPIENYLQWRGIVNAVKHLCQRNEKCLYSNDIFIKQGDVLHKLGNLDSKKLYNIIIDNMNVYSKAKVKFCKEFYIDNNKDTWAMIYTLPHRCLYNNEIKEMQFKILHRYVATNKLLYDMKKVTSQSCTFCNIHQENIRHLFFECTKLKSVWHFVESICNEQSKKQIIFTCKDVILGFDLEEVSEAHNFVNKAILYCKYYILQCKYNEAMPNIIGLKQKLTQHQLRDSTFCW